MDLREYLLLLSIVVISILALVALIFIFVAVVKGGFATHPRNISSKELLNEGCPKCST